MVQAEPLLAQIEGEDLPPARLPTRLIVRGSSTAS